MKLYVNVEKEKGEHIIHFLKKCYAEGYDGWQHKFIPTFYDIECTIEQCGRKRRSFDDLMDIVKTYYPKATKKHIAKQIEKLTRYRNLNCKVRLCLLFCPEAKKWIMYETSESTNILNYTGTGFRYLNNYNNSKSKMNDKGDGERSYYDILSLMGYTKDECVVQ
jgi:hypothetical protein